jgi:hypothetical protein
MREPPPTPFARVEKPRDFFALPQAGRALRSEPHGKPPKSHSISRRELERNLSQMPNSATLCLTKHLPLFRISWPPRSHKIVRNQWPSVVPFGNNCRSTLTETTTSFWATGRVLNKNQLLGFAPREIYSGMIFLYGFHSRGCPSRNLAL